MSHCGWCSTGKKAPILAHLRAHPHADTLELAKRHGVSKWVVQDVRKRARARGCLTGPHCQGCGVSTPRGGRCDTCQHRVHLEQWRTHNMRKVVRPKRIRHYFLPPIGSVAVAPPPQRAHLAANP